MIKSNHALILNRLHQMQSNPLYAIDKEELALAEQTILDLETENKRLMEDIVVQTRKVEELTVKLHPTHPVANNYKFKRLKILESELREACGRIPEAVDLIPRIERYFNVSLERTTKLEGAIEGLLETDDTPERNCSCHLSPPCNDCVEYGGRREALEFAKEAIK